MKRDPAIGAYLRAAPSRSRALLVALRKTIHALVPDVEEDISYGMPAFRYRGAVIAGFRATTSGASYYPFSGRTLASLGDDVAEFSQTKGALHFDEPLPKPLVRKLLKARIAELTAAR
jgi:uncharacterized protein YdhG (YjbR/CyaY superfamily)